MHCVCVSPDEQTQTERQNASQIIYTVCALDDIYNNDTWECQKQLCSVLICNQQKYIQNQINPEVDPDSAVLKRQALEWGNNYIMMLWH